MNERIKKLAKQAEDHADNQGFFVTIDFASDYQDCLMEKFAELIVRECVKEMSEQMYLHHIHTDQSNNPNFYKAVEKTLKHFGVEE